MRQRYNVSSNSYRIVLWVVFSAIVIPPAPQALAEEEPDTTGSEFIDMPEGYADREQVLEAQPARLVEDVKENPGYLPGYRRAPGLGLSPLAPQAVPALPGAIMPPFGIPSWARGLRFEFHGYLQAALRAGIGESNYQRPGTNDITFHGGPVVPGDAYGWFDHTNTVPTPWAQLNFRYGNDVLKGTVILGAWSAGRADGAAGYVMGNAQMLFTEAYLTYTPRIDPVRLKIDAGVFPDRYGFLSKYHQGAYGASLIADIYGGGATATLELPFEGNFSLITEGGFKGEFDKVPWGTPQNGSNDYARSEEGTTFAGHAHLAFRYADWLTIAAHYVHSWSQDDRASPRDDPLTPDVNESQQNQDGLLRIIGGDVRLDGGRLGYLVIGGSHVTGKHTNSLTDLVRVLNSGSGKEFNERYFGFASEGNGNLTLVGLQYSMSLGTLLRYPMEFWGVGPDLNLSVFGIFGRSESEASEVGDRNMLKFGGEAVYSVLPYLALAGRFDHVRPDLGNGDRSFSVFSPRVIFRNDWNSRASLTLQYSYYLLGDEVVVKGDNRLTNIMSNNPDHHLLAIYGTLWW